MTGGLLAVGVLFAAVAVAGAVARRVRLPVIPAYVLAGTAVGPGVAGRVGLSAVVLDETTTTVAELGIVMLLFFLGLEFSLDRLLAAGRRIGRAGTVDAVVNFPAGVALGLLFGWTAVEALLLGGIVYVSSSAVITKSLVDSGWIADPESEPVLGVLVFEDIVVAVYLAVVAALVRGDGGLAATARSVGLAVAVLLALFAAVRFGSGLFERALDVSSGEAFVLRSLGVVVPVAGVALALGVSEAVAAFFVGMGFSGTPHVDRLERLLTPVRDAFAALFFAWVGLNTDPLLAAGVAVPLLALVVVTAPTKFLTGVYAGRVFGLDDRRQVRVGTALVARGEFSLVIAALATTAGEGRVLTEVIPALAVGYVLVMSLLGAGLMGQADAVAGRLFPEASTGGN